MGSYPLLREGRYDRSGIFSGRSSWLPATSHCLQLGNRLSLHLHTSSIAYHSRCIPPLIGVLMTATAAVLHDRTNSGSPKLQPNKTIHPAHPPCLSRSNLYSDDTFPSEHTSIYDAPLALSNEDPKHDGEIPSPLDFHESPRPGLPLSLSYENLH